MAGGKETLRQKMIGMMYLVLTALLALQVSSNILDKFAGINRSLVTTATARKTQNEKQLTNIATVVRKDGRKQAMAVLEEANMVRSVSKKMFERIEKLKEQLITVTGGREPDGKLKGAKDEMESLAVLFGPGEKKNGEAYKLQKELNDLCKSMTSLIKKYDPKMNYGPMANDGTDEGGSKADWVFINFNAAPMIASQTILSKIENDVLAMESEILIKLASMVGAGDIAFDQIRAQVTPEASVLAAGTKYKALLYIAASSSNLKPKMKFGGSEINVDQDGMGKVEFTAQGGTYDQYGKVEKSWTGSISIPLQTGGDTTYTVTQKYTVVKPVIQIQSASVQALYLNCGNALNVQVPALGDTYQPRFEVTGGTTTAGAKTGEVTIVPNSAKVSLIVYSGGNLIGQEDFKVRGIPLPTIEILCGNKPCNEKNGELQPPRQVKVSAIPDESFKTFLPQDARYKVTEYKVTLARGRRPVIEQKFGEDVANLSRHSAEAKSGDRLVFEITQVTRRNFKNENEKVNMGNVIYKTVPIQ